MSKRCTRCQTVKPWSDFYAGKKWEDGTMRVPQSRCKVCMAELMRERRPRNSAGREWHKAWQRRAYRRWRDDPEWVGRRRDQDREARRRRHGVTPDRYRIGTGHTPASPHDAIDATAFAAWLRSIRFEFDTTKAMATALGVDDSTLGKVMNGTKATVAFSTVDRALCGYGRPDLLDQLAPQKVAA